MKHNLIYIGILFLMLSCNSKKQKIETNENIVEVNPTETDSKTELDVVPFDHSKYLIQKGRLGNMQIGMTISEAEEQFNGLRKEVNEAVNFGYGGGSPAYLYYKEDKVIFGLIPTLNTDTIFLIIAASPKLTTSNGLNPNSTVEEILNKYPNIKVNQNLMNSWEEIWDTTNNWEFVFMTEDKTVGEYPELEVPSKLININIKTDWITIK
jgi:hypothetical protein